MVPSDHPLAAVRDSFNAVFVEGAAVGDLMFYGRGAGGFPTASAVLGDVIDGSVNLAKGSSASIGTFGPAVLRPVDDLRSAFYVNLEVLDRPGVLATVAGAFGDHGVSIRSMEQEAPDEDGPAGTARLTFITHSAREADVRATLGELRGLDAVASVGSVLRVVGDD
jgi:homoserine dehydrogenase